MNNKWQLYSLQPAINRRLPATFEHPVYLKTECLCSMLHICTFILYFEGNVYYMYVTIKLTTKVFKQLSLQKDENLHYMPMVYSIQCSSDCCPLHSGPIDLSDCLRVTSGIYCKYSPYHHMLQLSNQSIV